MYKRLIESYSDYELAFLTDIFRDYNKTNRNYIHCKKERIFMNNYDRVCEMVDEYVQKNGASTEMSRGEFIDWVHEKYENISVEKNNLYPTDITYNLYNAGLKDFPGPNLCLWWVRGRDTFRLVGSKYKPEGEVIQYKGRKNERVVGVWKAGEFSFL